MRMLLSLILAFCYLGLLGCGQSGPLYLPTPSKPAVAPPIPLTET